MILIIVFFIILILLNIFLFDLSINDTRKVIKDINDMRKVIKDINDLRKVIKDINDMIEKSNKYFVTRMKELDERRKI